MATREELEQAGLSAEEIAAFEQMGDGIGGAQQPETPEQQPETPETPETPEQQPDTPETSEAPEGDGEEPDGSDRRVPLHVVKEARAKAREAKAAAEKAAADLAAEREQRIRLEERLSSLEKKDEPKVTGEPEDPEPDAENDPLGHVRWENRQLKRRLEADERQRQDDRIANEMNALRTSGQLLKVEFARQHPDYTEAEQFVIKSRIEEYKIAFPDESEQQIKERVAADLGVIAVKCAVKGPSGPVFVRNPSKVIYDIAVARGYKKAAAAEPNGGVPALDAALEDGATEPAKGAGAPKPPASARRRVEPTPSLSVGSGTEGGGTITMESLSRMSDADFARLYEKNPDLVTRLMQGG